MQRGMFNFDEIRIEYFRDVASFYEAMRAGSSTIATRPTRRAG